MAEYRTFAKNYNSTGPLIGEIWPNASQWLAGDQMDSVMSYHFRKNVIGFVRNSNWSDNNNNGTNNIPGLMPSQFDHALRAVRDDYPAQATAAMLNLLDSHDTNRALFIMTETGDTGLVQAKQRLEQFTYVGVPMVYYGDEVAINAPSHFSNNNGAVGGPYNRAPIRGQISPAIPRSTARLTPACSRFIRSLPMCESSTRHCARATSSPC